MNRGSTLRLSVIVILGALMVPTRTSVAQETNLTNKVIPVIVLDEVSLHDAIANLARMAGINYILDPSLSGFGSKVTGRWENQTAEKMLGVVLKEHNLVLVENPATTVSRIVSSNHVSKPAPVPEVGSMTNPIPLISLQDVALDEAIRNVAVQAHLQVNFDPNLSRAALPTLSVRWQNLTAMQALTALLENYELTMTVDTQTRMAYIRAKSGSP